MTLINFIRTLYSKRGMFINDELKLFAAEGLIDITFDGLPECDIESGFVKVVRITFKGMWLEHLIRNEPVMATIA